MNHIYQIIEKSALQYADNTAFHYKGHQLSYQVLKDTSDRLAKGLNQLGIEAGDKIGLMMPNIPHFPIAYFALMKIGAVVVSLSIYEKSEELHHQLEDAEVKGVVYWDGFRSEIREAIHDMPQCNKLVSLTETPEAGEVRLQYLIENNSPLEESPFIDPDETAIIIYTAGTTGRPKGAELSHSNILFDVESCSDFLKLSPTDGILACIPLYQPLGQTLVMNTFLLNGCTVSLDPKFDALKVLQTIQENQLTYLVGVPSMFRKFNEIPDDEKPDISHMKFCISSGDAMRQETMDTFDKKFKIPVIESYSLTEASPVVAFNSPIGEQRVGAIGLPIHGVDMRIVDEFGSEINVGDVGEVIVSGPNVMKGYHNRPEATKDAIRDGWLYTGDLARLDESGYGFIVARKNNLIVKSGFSVYPREVEKFLLGHQKVKEAGVVGLSDDRVGEEIYAAVVVKEGEQAAPEEIMSYIRERMAAYKCPKSIRFISELPRDASGRLLREKLKEVFIKG